MNIIPRKQIVKELEAFCDKFETFGEAATKLGVTSAQLSTARNNETLAIPGNILAKLGYGTVTVYVAKADLPAKSGKKAAKPAAKKPGAKKPAAKKAGKAAAAKPKAAAKRSPASPAGKPASKPAAAAGKKSAGKPVKTGKAKNPPAAAQRKAAPRASKPAGSKPARKPSGKKTKESEPAAAIVGAESVLPASTFVPDVPVDDQLNPPGLAPADVHPVDEAFPPEEPAATEADFDPFAEPEPTTVVNIGGDDNGSFD